MGTELAANLVKASPVDPTASDVKSADLADQHAAAENLSRSISNPSPAPPTSASFDSTPSAAAEPSKPTAIGSFADKLQASLTAARDGADAAMMSKPGSFSKLMVGASLDALAAGPFDPNAKGKQPTMNGVAPDAALKGGPGSHGYTADRQQAPKEAPAPIEHFGQKFFDRMGDYAGGGGAADMAARGALRVRQETMDRQTLATSNAEMMHQQALTHKLGDESMKENIADGILQKEAMISAPPNGGKAGTEDAKDKTSDELEAMIKSGTFHPTVQTAFPTGRRLIGTSKSGMPLYQTTYSVVTPPPNMYIDKKTAEHINEFTGSDLYAGDDPTKQMQLPGVQVNAMIQRANNTKTALAAMQKSQAMNDIEIRKDRTNRDVDTMAQNPVVQDALQASQTGPNDPFAIVKAFNWISTHPQLRDDPRLPKNWAEVYARAMGGDETGENFKGMVAKFETAATKNSVNAVDALHKLAGSPKELDGKGAPEAYAATIQPIIDHPEKFLPPGTPQDQIDKLKAEAADQMTIIKSVQKADHDREVTLALDKKSAEEDAEMPKGEALAALIDKSLSFDLDPEKMEGLRGGMRAKFVGMVLAEAKKRGIDWSEGDYKARYQTKVDFRPEGKAGQQIISLNTFGEHVQTAYARVPMLNNTSSPWYNKKMNQIKVQFGSEQYGRMVAALEAVKNEYLNFLKNAHASTTDEQVRAESILNPDLSPQAIRGVLAQMADTIAKRGGQLQRSYITTMKTPFVGMLDPGNDEVLRGLGINTDKMNGIPASVSALKPQPAPAGAPDGASMTYRDKQGNIKGYALNGKYVEAK